MKLYKILLAIGMSACIVFSTVRAQSLVGKLIVEYESGAIKFLQVDVPPGDPQQWLEDFRSHAGVKAAQWDYPLEFHRIPNDPRFSSQWSLPQTGTDQAWNKSTGGVTATGDTIVVAILDRGFDIGHADLRDNLWTNRGEIQGDGIDNDGNGYADDFFGWNFIENTPNHPIDNHGTSVAGIIGAVGNNTIGVSGINWKIKLMLLTTQKVSDVIKACQYIEQQRELYRTTNGRQGAFVVVANNSFGVSGVFCRQQPVWSRMIDKLGRVGVLTAAATTNSPVNVDEQGDMPSTCLSPFLITVLSTDRNDRKEGISGFGEQSIDLGAPGVDVFTTNSGNRYGTFSGTSAAAPHITGAVALLYSIPCTNFAGFLRQSPEQAALAVRQAILEGTAPNGALKGLCATGGRLSIGKSMEILSTYCDKPQESGEVIITRIYPNPTRGQGLVVSYTAPDAERITWRISNSLGQVIKEQVLPAPMPWPDKRFYISLDGIPRGTYAITLSAGANRTSRMFIHQ